MNREAIQSFFDSELPALCGGAARCDDAGYALPDASLACLREIIRRLGVTRVLEFGTGRSTRLFLEEGCDLTSLEDSASWLDETRSSLNGVAASQWHPVCAPLRVVWHRCAPFMSWKADAEVVRRLSSAELVLVDSPALPPFREHALLLALRHARNALVVMDDANIPTVRRFCERLARRNALAHFHTPLDHGLFFLATGGASTLESRGPLETLKAWRRFLLRNKFCR